MQLQRYKKPLMKAGALLAAACLGFALLPLLLPFLLAYLLASAAEPAVAALGRRTPLPRWGRSGLCVTGLFLLVCVVLCFFGRVLWEELLRLVRQLPGLLAQLQPTLRSLREGLEALAAKAPEGLAAPLIRWIGELFDGGAGLLESVYAFLSGLVSGVVAGVPGLFLGTVTTVVATYMTSAALPQVKAWLRRRLPQAWLERLRELRARTRAVFGGWCRAQVKLGLVVFGLLALGLWLLGVEFPLLFGGIIALLDALPVLGTGTVLIPWALVSFLQERSGLGFGLLALSGAASLTRSVLEPHLVGRQLGLPPLATLMAFYAGYRLFGVAGMILSPVLAVLVWQLYRNEDDLSQRVSPSQRGGDGRDGAFGS
ncbi:MAG: sporulation integral membrane protein YtvI [Oscillospiraceae bacterium]|nr:sporulation integral membrane protein YtvI [Oscillospiraceae bacterium]